MRELADAAKTPPTIEEFEKQARAASTTELAVNFTPVDLPARQTEEVVKVFATGSLAEGSPFAPVIESESLVRPAGPVNCQSCGSLSDAADLFCITCGEFLEACENPNASMEAAPKIPICGECGTESSEGEIFCLTCGAVVD